MSVRRLQTNFTAGELTPRLDGRPDLAKYYNGAATLENVFVFPQGGVSRRPGTRYAGAVKTSADPTRIFPFIFNAQQAYILEFGDAYLRFWNADGTPILTSAGGPAYEISTPYAAADVFALQSRQSADVLYLVHPDYAPRKLSRVSDTNWVLSTITFIPPPTYDADTDIGTPAGATLTPAATTGEAITFTASAACFLAADVGRMIVYGSSRAVIITYTDTTHVDADIIDAFPDTDPIAAGAWLLRNSPQTTLDPNKRAPVNTQVQFNAGAAAFRAEDVGKYLKVYGGVARITIFTSTTIVKAQLLSVMSQTTDTNPSAAGAGTWTLEVDAWSDTLGWPSSIEFHEGRLGFAGVAGFPTTFWLSRSGDYENMAVGALADDALEYTLAFRQVNVIRWLASMGALLIGDAQNEHEAVGAGIDEPLGGDVLPRIRARGAWGSAAVQALVLSDAVLFHQAASRQVYLLRDTGVSREIAPAVDLTILAEHITSPQLAAHPAVFAGQPNRQLFFVRSDGVLLVCTYYPEEQVAAWSRYVLGGTDAAVESAAVIPHPDGDRDRIWVSVARTINGATVRSIEYFDDNAAEMSGRNWTSLYTDSAVVYSGSAATVISGLSHLEGESVDVIADGSYKGRFTVASGQITLATAASVVEVGLPYTSTIVTMRPALPQGEMEGVFKGWLSVTLRLYQTIGGTLNGQNIPTAVGGMTMDSGPPLKTGDQRMQLQGWDAEGRLTLTQPQPYPLTLLALFGDVEVGAP